MGPRFPPWPIIFIMSAIWRWVFRRRLTSSTFAPAPAAMRFLREALSSRGCGVPRGVIELMMAIWRLITLPSMLAEAIWFFILAMPGIMPINPPMPPMLLHLAELVAQVVQVELALAHLVGDAKRLFLRRSTAPPSRRGRRCRPCRGCGWRCARGGNPPARPSSRRCRQLDRLAGDGAHRERRAAAAVAVDARQHDAGDADPPVEGARGVDRVLAGQRVGDEQHLVRVGRRLAPRRPRPSAPRRPWCGPRCRA